MSDTIFALSYVLGFVVCFAQLCWTFYSVETDRLSPWSSEAGFAPGLAGFMLFPLVNNIVAVIVVLYWLRRRA